MKGAASVLLYLVSAGCCWLLVLGQDCPVDIAPEDRRDCFPWAGADTGCAERGCVWCPLPEGVEGPWCYANDLQCPSEIPESERQDCHPEPGATKQSCMAKGCIWCNVVDTPGAPACFFDSESSMGGEFCPEDVPENERVDCWPNNDATLDKCLQRNCYWCASETPGVPWCFAPPVQGYEMVGAPEDTTKGVKATIKRRRYPTWFGGDVETLTVEAEFQEDARLRIKIYDPANERYEVPLSIPSPDEKAANPLYDVQFSDSPAFHIKVLRRGSGEVLFDTSLGAFHFADQGLQFATRLPSANVYGFGETEHHSFRHNMDYQQWPMYARDQPVTHKGNLYGVHPFYMALDQGADAHGVLILNSNAQEVEMIPTPGLIYRTVGGILDLYFFLGPTPENVVQQYTQAIGRPIMPPYWSLGFHLSRYGYNSLDNLRATIDRLRQYDIPHDVQHGDIDYYEDRKIFTYDTVDYAGLPEYVDQIRAEGTKFVTILDPCVDIEAKPYPVFDRGMAADVWVKEADGVTNARGRVWPDGEVYFPDYSRPSCQDWWIDETVRFNDIIKIDGLWIDMNEPASFVTGTPNPDGCDFNQWNYPLYKPKSIFGDVLADKTVCPDFLQDMGRHYDVHSLYGWSQCEPSLRAARAVAGKRSIVISRSTFPGAGKYATHWLGDNYANWENLYYSIIGMLEFNLFGIPFVGADICGFGGDTTEELCLRWHQLGAFYTFSRNHNAIDAIDHDPGVFGPEFAARVRSVLHVRYTLLPYLYTLFYEANVRGSTVIRPLHHEFVTDENTYGIDRQFLWGSAFLITPVLTQGATQVTGYFPDARWYDYYDGSESNFRGESGSLAAPLDVIPLHVRGGFVLPTQQPGNTTEITRHLPMGLIVAMDDAQAASGRLFWDEGDTIDTIENGEYFEAEYQANDGTLQSAIVTNGYSGVSALIFDNVRVYGLEQGTILSVSVNGDDWQDFDFNEASRVLIISNLEVAVDSEFTISWS